MSQTGFGQLLHCLMRIDEGIDVVERSSVAYELVSHLKK